jgi:rhamnulose-1-phosphate aldolase
MRVLDAGFTKDFIRTCDDGWRQGWHECHGGNLSYRLKEAEALSVSDDLRADVPWVPLDIEMQGLSGEHFLVTGGGKYFRNAILDPEDGLGILEISSDGKAYRQEWGFGENGRPTSELPAHLLNHEIKKQATGGRHRVIYHAHPANIIALSFVLPLTDEVFTRELWEMMPECAMTFPSGIGVVPWMVPGQAEISLLSGELMKKYDVILWAQHGLFSSGETLDGAFGLIHTVEKAAEILLKVLSVGPKRQAATLQDFKDMAKAFRLNLPQRFLYEK